MITAAWLCLFLPLAGFAAITLAGTRIGRQDAGLIATTSVAAAFAFAVTTLVQLLRLPATDRTNHVSTLWTWLDGGQQLKVGFSILVDPLSVFMMLVVTGVGALIVAYAIGYMKDDDEERRFFAYMALFVFSMLLLVQGGNLLLLLAGWGMVGLSSYLLIGYWHHKPEAIAAAKKAFVMNAIGDVTIVIALFLIVQYTGTLDFQTAFDRMQILSGNTALVNIVALGLLGGAVAKSAQLPLQTWLPDAMEGPTPVSALIHAATMVTAGVFLVFRTAPLFELAPKVQDLVAALGCATLLIAGLVALVQNDIKRVIAYSTMSQIGYMFVAEGTGAYSLGTFHLLTHAFFKADLFLCAGIVIHALADEQDIRKMGGLRKLMPLTFLFFLAGGLALVGIPPFSGWFSKDPILAATLARGDWFGIVLWMVGMAGAFLTGLYTFRLIFRIFWGEKTEFVEKHFHPHGGKEGPPIMVIPVAVLAVGATFIGWIQFSPFWTPISTFLAPVAAPLVEATNTQEALSAVVGPLMGAAGIAVAWWLYVAKREAPPKPWAILEHKFYFDEAYDAVFAKPVQELAAALGRNFERPIIGGSIAGTVTGTRETAQAFTLLQSGFLRFYALALASGVAIIAIVFLAAR